jgi:cytoskeleton protein RodZ
MPDIGATLREARMRAHVDISEIESATKIRAKYLRALENEEWDLLPGPTYVKSFLRTYADALGLDGKLLIEEYKQRHERLSDVDLQPIAPRGVGEQRRRRERRGIAPGWIVGAVLAGLLVALYLLGRHSGGGSTDTTPIRAAPPPATTPKRAHKGASAHRRPAPPAKPRLTLVASGPVYVCLQAAGGRTLLPGVILQSGDRRGPYRSSAFRITLGNGNVRMVLDGRSAAVPAVQNGIGYVVTSKGRRTLPPGQRPTCGG